jgi:lipopolysaccharide/colanic/teichoic acid biosynthesis glycosyltransferase
MAQNMQTMKNKRKRTFYETVVKRPADFLFVLVLLAALSWLLLIIAVLSKIFCGRSIYKQKRVGKGRKIFWFYKFSSMNNKRDANGNPLPDRERITKYGKFIRKTSLDELLQLLNILKGDMSFIGPRPKDIKECVFFNEEQCARFAVRPGISGLAQVNGRNSMNFEKIVEFDTKYVQKVSFWGDFKILFKTFFVVFKRKGIDANISINETHHVCDYYCDILLRRGDISREEYDARIQFSKTLNAKDFMPSIDMQRECEIGVATSVLDGYLEETTKETAVAG